MAIWAALISVVGGGILSKQSRDAQKKANEAAQGNISESSKTAISGQQEYADVGKQAFYQLAGLAGIQGYRTPAEIAYTEHIKAGPPTLGATGDFPNKYGDMLNKNGFIKKLGPEKAGALWALGTGLPPVIGKNLGGHAKRKAAVEAARNAERVAVSQREQQAKYESDVAAWNDQSAKLKAASKKSIKNYNPTANLEKIPGYQFRLNQGQKATNAMSSAQGDVLSGQGIKRLQENAQGLASQEYGNEFNRLLALSGIGQNAATAQGNLSVGAGSNLANLNLQSGQNQANYYNNLNDLTQGAATNIAYLNNRDSKPTGSSYDVNSPTSNPNYKPGQTLDPALYD
jgi:hypothetical protein